MKTGGDLNVDGDQTALRVVERQQPNGPASAQSQLTGLRAERSEAEQRLAPEHNLTSVHRIPNDLALALLSDLETQLYRRTLWPAPTSDPDH